MVEGRSKSDNGHWIKLHNSSRVNGACNFHMLTAKNGDEAMGTGFLHYWGASASTHAL